MMDPCTQEENIGYIKGKIESIFEKFETLDKRLNGSFDAMAKHCEDSTRFRELVMRHQTYFKVIAIITIPIVIYILKEIIKHITVV